MKLGECLSCLGAGEILARGLCSRCYQRHKKLRTLEQFPRTIAVVQHSLDSTYRSMIRRCTDPRHASWHLYGGRGITVCDRWLTSFDDFVSDVGARPEGRHPSGWPLYTLDRIDGDGPYSPDNVRWANDAEQNANRRKPEPKEFCPQGHPYAETEFTNHHGRRECRLCRRAAVKRSKDKRKASQQ